MYHYVNDFVGSITVSARRFDEHCRVLSEQGWRGVSLPEAENFLIHGETLPPKSFLMTFDDGFYDNYVNALPIMQKHGHKGVVFAVSDRLEISEDPRAGLDDVLSGRAVVPPAVATPVHQTKQGFTVRDDVFLNHAEARLADAEGTLAVASHAQGHYGVFTGPEFSGFTQPGTCLRTFYRTEQEIVWGLPAFGVKAGLLHRGFLPNPALVEAVVRLVPQEFDGASDFFSDAENKRALEELASSFTGNLGRFETDSERTDRMWREISGGKEQLESILGHSVRTLCWPWGQYCPEALQLAKDAGFKLFFTTREGSNPPAQPEAVRRFKAKDKSGEWLTARMSIYSRPLLGALYAKIRI